MNRFTRLCVLFSALTIIALGPALRAEHQSGTDPGGGSVFGFADITTSNGSPWFSWSSVEGRLYEVQRSSSGTSGPFVAVASHIAATPPTNTYYDTAVSGHGKIWYRIAIGHGGGGNPVTTVDYAVYSHLQADASTGGTVDVSGAWFPDGELATVGAMANPGHAFTGWSGDAISSDNPLRLTMTRAYAVTADFSRIALPTVSNGPGATPGIGRAALNGLLTGAAARVRVFWGTTDGGTDADAWEHVSLLGWRPEGAFSVDTGAGVDWGRAFTGTDVGSPAHAGSTSASGGTWTVTGGGADIWGPADSCHYAHAPVRGDFDVHCRVHRFSGGINQWRKGGIMARQSLHEGSRNVFVARTPAPSQGRVLFHWRTLDGQGSAMYSDTGLTAPYYWLRLKREGNTFSGYWADDIGGARGPWTQIGHDRDVGMDREIRLGLAVTAHENSTLTSCGFDGFASSEQAPELLYGVRYYYRTYATNAFGEDWADTAATFTTVAPGGRGETGLVVRSYDEAYGEALLAPISNLIVLAADATNVHTGTIDYPPHGNITSNFPALTSPDRFALLWQGVFLGASTGATYTFGTASDDGSMIYFDLNADGDFDDTGELVVDNNGFHGLVRRTGTVTVTGDTAIAIGFFEMGGGEAMQARWREGGGWNWEELFVLDCGSGDFMTGSGVGVSIENQPVSNVTETTATLNGVLYAPGSVFDVHVYWGPMDGGTDPHAWSNIALVGSYADAETAHLSFDAVNLAPGTSYYYAFRAGNACADLWALPSATFRTDAPPPSPLVINEFLADNEATLLDGDGDASDWIEVYNAVPHAVDLSGWALTDDADELQKWLFPPGTMLSPGGYLVVFASGKGGAGPGHELHTNFRLSSAGEYLGLVAPDGVTIVSEYAPHYPGQFPDISYGIGLDSSLQYFSVPTPGGPNIVSPPGPAVSVHDVAVLEGDSGWTHAEFAVTLAAAGAETATVHYATADGDATADADYMSRNGVLTFAPGQTNAHVLVPVRGDVDDEGASESFRLNLFHAVNCVVDDGSATGTILDDDMLLNDWRHSMRIVFDGYTGSDTLSNFPALVVLGESLPGFSYEQFASATGGDLRFTDDDETMLLNYEIEHWGGDTGPSYVWVQVPELAGTSTAIRAYWGNPFATVPPPCTANGATWSAEYLGVWHMGQTNVSDSTSAGNDGTAHGNVTAPGCIAAGQSFSNAYVSIPNEAHFDCYDRITASAWVKVTEGWRVSWQAFMSKGGDQGQGWLLRRWSNRSYGTFTVRGTSGMDDPQGSTDLGDGEWHHIAGVFDGNTRHFYVDGRVDSGIVDTGTIARTDYPVFIGAAMNQHIRHRGGIDEVRIEHASRSTDWIRACWLNQASNHTFGSYGEVVGGELDSDGDGLPDWWEFLYFGDPIIAEPDADIDMDGMSNLAEYVAGTIPVDAHSRLRFTDVRTALGVPEFSWSSVSNRHYAVDLSQSGTGGVFSAVAGVPATPPANTYRDASPPASGELCYRVVVRRGGIEAVSVDFAEYVHVNIGVHGAGSVDRPGGWFVRGGEAMFTATPAPGHRFVEWTGDVASTNRRLTVTMDRPRSIVARFAAAAPSISGEVLYSGMHTGTVQVSATSVSGFMNYVVSLDGPGPYAIDDVHAVDGTVSGQPADDVPLSYGTSFGVMNNQTGEQDVVIMGAVPLTPFMDLPIQPGMNYLGYPYPVDDVSWEETALALESPVGSRLFLWDASNGVFRTHTRTGDGWFPANARLRIAEGFVYVQAGDAVTNWHVPIPYDLDSLPAAPPSGKPATDALKGGTYALLHSTSLSGPFVSVGKKVTADALKGNVAGMSDDPSGFFQLASLEAKSKLSIPGIVGYTAKTLAPGTRMLLTDCFFDLDTPGVPRTVSELFANQLTGADQPASSDQVELFNPQERAPTRLWRNRHGHWHTVAQTPSYDVRAFMDADRNGVRDAWDPQGHHVGNPVAPAGGATGVDVVLGAPGLRLAVHAHPARHGTPRPYGYGTHLVAPGTVMTGTVPSPVDETGDARYVCTGWTGAGSVPSSGAGNFVTFTMTLDSILTWNWVGEYWLDVRAAGLVDDPIARGWHREGSHVTVSAPAFEGHCFVGWSGDTNGCAITGETIAVPMTRARTILADYVVDAYSITATSGAHGRIAPSGAVEVVRGADARFEMRPDAHCHVVDVIVDGTSRGNLHSYVFRDVTTNHSIHASFAPNAYSVGGRVHYFGQRLGPIVVAAVDAPQLSNGVGSAHVLSHGRYRIEALPALGTYWIQAYMDSNTNGVRDAAEPHGLFRRNPIVNLSHSRYDVHIRIDHLEAPTDLRASAGADVVTLRWSAVTQWGRRRYNVYRALAETGPFQILNSVPLVAPRFVDSVVQQGVTYYYYVTAVRASHFLPDYAESPPSEIVSATPGAVTLWMPDYFGQTGATVRLQINADNAHGILAADMDLSVSYDPALLTPISQVNSNLATVEKSVITEAMQVSDNGLTATGVIDISASSASMSGASLKILGCDLEDSAGDPLPVKASYSLDGGLTWVSIHNDKDLNDGNAHAVDLSADIQTGTNVILAVDAVGHRFRSDIDRPFWVHALERGDCMTNLPGIAGEGDLAYYLRPLVDTNLVLTIGSNDVVYLFEFGGEWGTAEAPWQDVVAHVEFNAGRALVGEGRLFDVLFRVSEHALMGQSQVHSFVSAELRDQNGRILGVDTTDTAVFAVSNLFALGDVDGDGDVDVRGDVVLAAKIAAGRIDATAYHLLAGDIDRDGEITCADVTLIYRLATGRPINPGGHHHGRSSSMFAAAGAGEGYELSIGAFEAQPGETIDVPIHIDNAEGLANVQIRLAYNAAVVSVQGVTNGALTAAFTLEHADHAGFTDIVLSHSEGLPAGSSGVLAVVRVSVSASAEIGVFTDLSLARRELGNEFGGDLSLTHAVSVMDGGLWTVASDAVDTDGDGLSDYAEQRYDGSMTVDPYGSSANPDGMDTDYRNPDTDGDTMPDGWEATHGLDALGDDALADTDGDGAPNRSEWIAGTHPGDGNDVLRAVFSATYGDVPGSNAPAPLVVEWQSVTGRLYSLRTATNLLTGAWMGVPGITDESGTGSTMSYTNPAAGGPVRLYRVRVRKP